MKKKYEFKIEDINSVKSIATSSDKYTVIYTRKFNNSGKPTRSFIVTYDAVPEERKYDKNKIITICKKCGAWNSFDKDIFYSEDFEFICGDCYDQYEEIISEEDLIKVISSLIDDEDTFFGIDLYINDIHIK